MSQSCSLCHLQAIKQCVCSWEYFCAEHCTRHIFQRGNHEMIGLDSKQRRKPTKELSSRIKAINKCKARISKHASYLINRIEELATRAIEKLDKIVLDYNNLITANEYSKSQIRDLTKILRTDFELKVDPALEKVDKFEEYFAQEFFEQSSASKLNEEYFAQEFFEQSSASKLNGFFKVHTAQIWCVAATNDCQTIISGGEDLSIKLWSVANQEVISTLPGHNKAVKSIAISKNNRYLASGSFDRTVRVWKMSKLRQLFILKGHTKKVLSVAFSNDCRWIASGSADNSVCIWSFAEQRLHKKLTGHTNLVNVVAFTENMLFSGAEDCRIIKWDINSFKNKSVLKAAASVSCLDISKDYTQIAFGLVDGKIQLLQNRKNQVDFTGHESWVSAVKFACQNKRIISASIDQTVCVWSIEQKSQLASFAGHVNWVTSLAVLCDDLFVSGSFDCSMILWDASTLIQNSVIKPKSVDFNATVFDENRLIYPSGNSVMVWNVDNNCVDAEFKGHHNIVKCVAIYRNFIVSGSFDSTVRVWSLITGSQVIAFTGHTGSVWAVAMCENIVVSGSSDKTVRLWNLKTNREAGILSGHTAKVRSVALTSSADKVVSSSNDITVRVWSVSRLQLLFLLTGHKYFIEQVGLSYDDKYIFSGSEGEECIRVWGMNSRAEVCCWKNLKDAEEWLSTYPEMRRLIESFIF